MYDVLTDMVLIPLLKDLKTGGVSYEISTECQEKWLVASHFKMFESMFYGSKTKSEILLEIQNEYERLHREFERKKKLAGNDLRASKELTAKLNFEPELTDEEVVDFFQAFIMAFIWSFGTAVNPG